MDYSRIIKCTSDSEFMFDRRVKRACGCEFILEDDNVFEIESLCCDEVIKQYYTICPYCGYLVLVDTAILSNSMRNSAEYKNNLDPYLFRKNNVLSELMNLEMVSKVPVKKRVSNF